MPATIASTISLPTLDHLGHGQIPFDSSKVDPKVIAGAWIESLKKSLESPKDYPISSLTTEDGLWRDILAFTWDFRTFHGKEAIDKFVQDRVSAKDMFNIKLSNEYLELQPLFPDFVWIQAMFTFETPIGLGTGVVHLVPVQSPQAGVQWRSHTILTNLENLKNFPEQIGTLRNHAPNHGLWASQRKKEQEFVDADPAVVIIGGGQSGLDIAARLKILGVSALIIERQARVGDQWRNRYEALCLHDPIWYDHMPYINFPASWPVFTPALKLADWLESYSHSMELNVWTSTTAEHAEQDPTTHLWTVTVTKADGSKKILKTKHVVMALGIGGGTPKMPVYPGQSEFKGTILHSSQHHRADDHAGKKVAVVGACTSAHDICADYYENGIDVTMVQRSPTHVISTKNVCLMFSAFYSETSPPVDTADRLAASIPNNLLKLIHQRLIRAVSEIPEQKKVTDGLERVGFQTYLGEDDSGFLWLALQKASGYYLDVGTSQLIADGKIKIKSRTPISKITPTGLLFEDQSTLDADVIVFATGFGDARDPIRKICGDAIADKLTPIWGLDEEGEMRGAWRFSGVERLWIMTGNLAMCRFHSKHLALQIKAIEEGIYGTRYSLKQ